MQEPSPILLTLIILAGFPLVFLAIWLLVLWINSYLVGWRLLARQYRYDNPFLGKLHRFQSVYLRIGKYSGSVNIGVNESGVYFVPILLFRPFHKPIFIPWHDIETKQNSMLFVKSTQLTFKKEPRVKFSLPPKAFRHLAPYLGDDNSTFS